MIYNLAKITIRHKVVLYITFPQNRDSISTDGRDSTLIVKLVEMSGNDPESKLLRAVEINSSPYGDSH